MRSTWPLGSSMPTPSAPLAWADISIGYKAFAHCTNLTNVAIPDSILSVEQMAFIFCSNLTRVTIPARLTNNESMAFHYCTSLASISVELSNSTYSSAEGVLFDKNQEHLVTCPGGKTGSYTIPDTVTSIDKDAFCGCLGLTNINIPDSVTRMENLVFHDCQRITHVRIPQSVTTIETETFSGCPSLNTITVDPLNPVYSSQSGVLFNKSQTILVRFPQGKAGSYTVPPSVTKSLFEK